MSNSQFDIPEKLYDTSNLSKSGKADALSDRPLADSSSLPESFHDAINVLRAHYSKVILVCQEKLNELEDECDKVKNLLATSSLKSNANIVISEVSKKILSTAKLSELQIEKRILEKRAADLEKFRIKHARIYDPAVPFVGGIKAVIIITVLYLLEVLFNAFMFFGSSSAIQAVIISLSTSLVNVVLGFFVGRWAITSLFFHSHKSIRAINLILSSLFIGLVIWLNLMIAIFRSILTAAEDSFALTISTVDAVWPFDNLAMLDFNGALLVGVGIVFALAALLDGWFSDDTYPGYGKIYRVFKKQENKLSAMRIKLENDAYDEIKIARSELQEQFNRNLSSIDTWNKGINKIQKTFIDFEEFVGNLNEIKRRYWDAYLSAHQSHQTSSYVEPSFMKAEPSLLLNPDYVHPENVFEDVAHSYMTDEKRDALASKMRKDTEETHNELLSSLDEVILNMRVKLQEELS